MTPKACFTSALVLALGTATFPAAAQSDTRLSDTRQAYASVDYEGTRALAKAALERGGNTRAATAELYWLWALAAAALEQTEEARGAFNYALAVNPELKVDRNLSPKIRAPYQEARGALTRPDGKPALGLNVRRHEQALELTVEDTQQLVETVELSIRSTAAEPFSRQRWQVSPSRRVALPNARGIECFARLLDAHGNVLFELGSESDPRTFAPGTPLPPLVAEHRPTTTDVNRVPYYVTTATLATLGLAAGGVSLGMYAKREARARDWNGPGCEKPGATRAEQCGAIDDRRRSAEHLSIGFAAASGALLVGSVVSLLLVPSSGRAAVSLATTPHSVMLGLTTAL
jgi:hypothetical protein